MSAAADAPNAPAPICPPRAAGYNPRRLPRFQGAWPMPDTAPNAIATYQAAVSSNPNSAEAQSNLGWGYYGQRKFDDAIAAFRQALTLDRNYLDAHYGLALTLKESGAGQDAVPEFETVLNLAPQDANTIRGQMLSRLARGHINRIKSGDWGLNTDIIRPNS